MRSAGVAFVGLLGVLTGACGDETKRPPAIDATAGSSPAVGGGAVGGDESGTTGRTTGTSTSGSESSGTATTGGNLSVLSGSILTDVSFFPLPMNCTLNLHEPGAVDPGTGLSSGPLIQIPAVLDEPVQTFDIGLDTVRDVIDRGDLVYVEVRCDIDGDGTFDPVGGWFPLLPAELVELPAENIDLVVGDLPV